MLKMIVMRVGSSLPSLFGVLVIAFVLTRALPGDPAAFLAGPAASQEAIEQIREELGLNKGMFTQFVEYTGDVFEGNLGTSWSTGQPVLAELKSRFPASIELTFLGLIFAIIIAVPLGVVSATRPGSWIDHSCRLLTTAGVSLPIFFTGLLLVYLFYYLLGWAPPPMGRLSMFSDSPPDITGFFLLDSALSGQWSTFKECLAHIALPAINLGIFALAPIARMTRASMLGVLSSDFIRTARAHQLPNIKILYTYALHNAILPVITTLGMVFSFLLGANVLVEKVFSWPGVGSFALEAVIISDYAAVQGFVLAMGIFYVFVNLFIDIFYGVVDPRVRIEA